MSKIAQPRRRPSIFLRESFNAKIWPNGEAVLSRPQRKKTEPSRQIRRGHVLEQKLGLFVLAGGHENADVRLAVYMGLSIRPISDSVSETPASVHETDKPVRARKGLSGITSYGKRMIRNATHMLQRKGGRSRCIFATVTLPGLPIEQMHVVHENWSQLVEYYRLGIRRELQKHKLSGELVTVTEVQEKRYKKTGLPVMHLHSVFVGVDARGKYAISTERHDDIWVAAVNSVVVVNANDFAQAGNLQRVRKCAAAYLGKYMSKGAKVVASVIRSGFGEWLPYHWWSCSRTLTAEVKRETRVADSFADWLYDMTDTAADSIWAWHGEVVIELKSGKKLLTAIYGLLKPEVAWEIRDALDP